MDSVTPPSRRFGRRAGRAGRLFIVLAIATACQPPWAGPSCNVAIDWVNFVHVDGLQYVAAPGDATSLSDQDLGRVHARVKFRVSGNVCDPGYRVKDGDAAFLDPGTPIYEVAGHPASEELAARVNGRLVVYRPAGGP